MVEPPRGRSIWRDHIIASAAHHLALPFTSASVFRLYLRRVETMSRWTNQRSDKKTTSESTGVAPVRRPSTSAGLSIPAFTSRGKRISRIAG